MKDRIVELKRVKASDLLPNRAALAAVLDEIGHVNAIKVVKTRKGLMIVDGHLRQDVSGDDEVPVMVLNISEREADKMLATFDPLAAMAGVDKERLAELLDGIKELRDRVPNFEPVSVEFQARLDQKKSIACPSCGHVFTP